MTRSLNDFKAIRRAFWTLGLVAIATAVASPVVSAAGAATVLSSVASGGARGNDQSGEPSLSKTGRFVAFFSGADNLVAGDGNGAFDCFVRDHFAKTTEFVSVNTSGALSNGDCFGPTISGDGRYVAFESKATNLANADGDGKWDIFVRDRQAGTTELISVHSSGAKGNDDSRDAFVSASGRYVVFESLASNLVPGDTNGTWDVFIRDRVNNTTDRVSVRSNGTQGNRSSRDPAVSGSGRFVVFQSFATNLVWRDTNKTPDIFIHDRETKKTRRVSLRSNEQQARGGSADPSISASGRYIAFGSKANNLVRGDTNGRWDVFVRDRSRGTTKRVSVRSGGRQANGVSGDPTISWNGRWIAFESSASNLVAGDTNGEWDAFVHDRVKVRTRRVSVRSDRKQARNGLSDDAAISGDGTRVTFESQANNLVKNDRNQVEDVFRRGPLR